MENEKTYIVADFVKILDVPRTTLKDWLSRYEDYIEFEIRGRRKIYFESSLVILKEIAKLRKAGKTAPQILLELSSAHPVNTQITHEIEMPQMDIPEIEQEQFPVKHNPFVDALLPLVKQQNEEMEHMLTNKLHDMASSLHEAQIATLLPIVKRQNQKMERMVTGRLNDMAENLHRNQLDGNKLSKQSARRILVVIALILTLVAAVVLTSSNIYYVLMNQKRDLDLVERSLERNISQSKKLIVDEMLKRKKYEEKQVDKLDELSTMLKKSKERYHDDIISLKDDMKRQQKSFLMMMKQYNKTFSEQRDNENIYKGNFDKERSVMMRKIDELIKQNANSKLNINGDDEKVRALKEKLFELNLKLNALEEAKRKAEQSALPASYFPKPVKPARKAVIRSTNETRPEVITVK